MELAATDAFQSLDIDGDGTSDEYDFMDDVAGGKEARKRNAQYKEPKRKYIDMLQKVADRHISEVTIELDDLDNVRFLRTRALYIADILLKVRKVFRRRHGAATGRFD